MSPVAPVALVVGGAGGIGAATAGALATAGHRVAVADLDRDRCASVTGGALALEVDVRSTASVAAAVAATVDQLGRLDVLVNAAGILVAKPAPEIDDADWAAMTDVHVSGTFRACRAAYPALAASGAGAIVNLSSPAAQLGIPRRAAYCAAKAAIEGLTRELAVEWGPVGIRVNAVSPGYTLTPMLQAAIDRGEADPDRLVARVPLRWLADAAAIADVIAFLASPQARYVSGHILVVDGGMAINGGIT